MIRAKTKWSCLGIEAVRQRIASPRRSNRMEVSVLRRILPPRFSVRILALAVLVWGQILAFAQQPPPRTRQFPVGSVNGTGDLPVGRIRTHLEKLPAAKRDRALQWLRSFHFTEMDLQTLQIDSEGGVFYIDPAAPAAPAPEAADPAVEGAAVPVAPFPASLVFHSRPGAQNILFLNFSGETVLNTVWNSDLGRTQIIAVPFSTDGDFTTFSDSEQAAIKQVWERVAEDYAPFNIDVTTERPASFTTRTAEAVITNNQQADGQLNPADDAGGVAYVNVFATSSYSSYRPAWIYVNNLGYEAGNIAEAAAHEIGHNMGLSHDGTTTSEYYLGHGSGEISWAPIMGAGYGRNVSQWSKGEYYLANNTQDDLAIIAGKLTYIADDHGNTFSTATAIVLSDGTNIVSTTLETDPTRTNTVNKGVIERNTDIDVFSFITGNGPVRIAVDPWITPSGTRGNNLDIVADLYSESGALLLTVAPPLNTGVLIQTNLAQGVYYLAIHNAGAGSPLTSPPTGYTSYGSLGQYFINGYVSPSDGVIIAPTADLSVTNITDVNIAVSKFTVTYSDNVGVDVSSLDSANLQITGPNGYDQSANFLSVSSSVNGTPRVATYSAPPPNGVSWVQADNGVYKISIRSDEVADVEGAFVPPRELGQFTVAIPNIVYSANMDTNPGWTLDSQWAYGVPADGSTGPTKAYTGTNVIGYNLAGNYANSLSAKYAVTPLIDCSTNVNFTLKFRRWLRVRTGDTASIQVSTNGTTWASVYAASGSVLDTTWQDVRYTLPAFVAGSKTVRLRWVMASNSSQSERGWNIDDVQVLGDGTLDTTPPTATLSVATLTQGGSPTHSLTVTYTDQTAVRLSSLDSQDILVTGPNGYSNVVEFIGADLPSDGSPINASYGIPAPANVWTTADNGTYQVTLVADEVSDTLNNTAPGKILGSFEVNIPAVTATPFNLQLTVNNAGWGSVDRSPLPLLPGTLIDVTATPAQFYRFVEWTGDLTGSTNPASLLMDTNKSVTAVFAEILTENHPTPLWWLAQAGYTNDFETVVDQAGANGLPLWESFLAGLNPDDPQSELRASAATSSTGELVLTWTAERGRLYTLQSSAALEGPFNDIQGAVDLEDAIQTFSIPIDAVADARFFRIVVRKP